MPLHLTCRIAAGLPPLRQALEAGKEHLGFRLTQFSVQANRSVRRVEFDFRRRA